MARRTEPPAERGRVEVLHLTGARADDGGILSVIRAIQEATSENATHRVWVQEGFRQLRSPELELVRSRHALDETPGPLRFLIRAAQAWPGLCRLLRENPEWVIHAHTRGTFPLAAWISRSQPVLFTQHAYARRTGMYRRVARWPGMRTVLLTPSMARHYEIAEEPGRVEILSECALDRWFERPLPAERPSHAGRRFRLVGLGNLVRWKRWDLALDALSRVPESIREKLELEVWGPTPPDSDAKRFADELRQRVGDAGWGAWVRFPGPTPQPAETLAAADAFLLPSTREPCSVALIEALASGVPALASRSGGNVDIIQDGKTGLLFAPDSADDLAAKLTHWITESPRFDSPAAVRASVAHRSASVVGARYLSLYQEFAASRRRALSAAAAG